MAEYIISKSSIVNRCNMDGKAHYTFTEAERPCEEAYLKDIEDKHGNVCSRYFIEVGSIEELDELGEKYNVDVMVTRNLDFMDVIAVLLYDEELNQDIMDWEED